MKQVMTLVGAALLAAIAAGAQAAELSEIWRATGFDNPESVAYDPQTRFLYVSNIGGDPAAHDGNGFISRLTLDGKIDTLRWVEGLDAPKGIAIRGGRLYAADIDRLVEIDIAAGQIADTYPAPGAKFLNDTAVGEDGRVFISDTFGNAIYAFQDGVVSRWLADAGLVAPNGLLVRDGTLLVAELGDTSQGFDRIRPGRVQTVDLATRAVGDFGSGEPIGVLDGIQPVPKNAGAIVVSDNPAGKLIVVDTDGKTVDLAKLESGTADFVIVPSERLVAVPVMSLNAVIGLQ